MFIDTCFLAQRECRNFLPEPCNTNSGEELPSLFRLFQVGLFSRQAWYIAANQPYVHQTSQKKACIRPCDTNNSTQSLTRIYLHTGTESLYRVHGAKITWTLILAGHITHLIGHIKLSIFVFPFDRNARSPDHQFFYFFLHEVSHRKVRKVMDPSF